MGTSAQGCVTALVESHAPASLLIIGDPPTPPATDADVCCVPVAAALAELAALGRFEFAIVSELVEQLEDGRIAWRYDIDRYNPERPWNSPEDWAHPENFERFRW